MSGLVKVPMLISAFSGGNGIPHHDGVEMGEIHKEFISKAKAPYLLRLSGDSIEPEYRSGDLLVIDNDRQTKNKDVVSVFYDGEYLIKEYN